MTKSDYDYTIHTEEKTLSIVDLDRGNMSVTNDIENVVTEIAEFEQIDPAEYKIVYRDSQGCWDGWNHKKKSFIHLFSGSDTQALKELNQLIYA